MAAASETTPTPSVFILPISARDSEPVPTPTPPSNDSPLHTPSSFSTQSQHSFPLPKLRLEIRDLNHEGTEVFLTAVVASKALATSVQSVLSLLYKSPDDRTTTVPSTRSVTLILRSMSGVAYTTGSELDSEHKEIHFSLDYIRNSITASRATHEIMGVLTHEMVHCYQYNAIGTCPGGLIEGIADWVRLNCDLSPPHWKRDEGGKWDAGYQHTGYFLDYLEKRFGEGLIRRMNDKLRNEKYEEKRFWTGLCGRPVNQLWGDYQEKLHADTRRVEEEDCVIVERAEALTLEDGPPEPTATKKDTAEEPKPPPGVN